jgi:hypothetical protein
MCPAGFSPITVQNSSSPLFSNRPDHMACQSQSQSVQQVCLPPGQGTAFTPSGMTGQKNANRRRTLMFEGQWTLWDELEYQGAKPTGSDNQGLWEDPFADVTRTRDRGTSFTSATGTIGGQTVSGHTTDVGGGGGAYYTKSFNPSAYQTISVGGLFRYDSLRTTFDVDPLAGAFGNSGSANRDVYTTAAFFRYRVRDTYFAGGIAGSWGHGDWTDNVTPATGSYSSHGFMSGVSLGHVFTLFDALAVSRPSRITKGPLPATWANGYVVKLDVSGNVGYWRDRIGGFVDSSGFAWGDEQIRSWRAGGQAMLLANVYRGGYQMTPFVAATVTSDFSFSHTLDIPVQVGQIADTIFYGSPQTFWGVRGGWNFGLEGFTQNSSQYQVLGARAYVRTPIFDWLGFNGPSPIPTSRPR